MQQQNWPVLIASGKVIATEVFRNVANEIQRNLQESIPAEFNPFGQANDTTNQNAGLVNNEAMPNALTDFSAPATTSDPSSSSSSSMPSTAPASEGLPFHFGSSDLSTTQSTQPAATVSNNFVSSPVPSFSPVVLQARTGAAPPNPAPHPPHFSQLQWAHFASRVSKQTGFEGAERIDNKQPMEVVKGMCDFCYCAFSLVELNFRICFHLWYSADRKNVFVPVLLLPKLCRASHARFVRVAVVNLDNGQITPTPDIST